MMNGEIRLSVVIPIYKVEKYIDKCLGSLLNEKTKGLPFEVMCVNDGTPDNSMVIVNRYAKYFGNVRLFNQDNQGQSVARNTGLELTKGEYVWFVDSDDWLEPYSIHTLIDLMEQNLDIDIFAVPSTWKYDDSNKDWIDLNVADNTIMSGRKYQDSGFQMAAWQFVTKRSLLKENNILFYPGIIHEDGLWGFEIMYLAQSVMVIKQPLYCYRQRQEGSVMHNIGIRSGYCIIKVHEQLMKFMDEHVQPEDKKWFQKLHVQRIQEAIHIVWHLRHTPEFKIFLADTIIYRHHACKECAKLGGFRWRVKCWLMKYPVLNENLRIIKKTIKACL